MNFKRNSLFQRNMEPEEEIMEPEGGVLAVWGSPSSGKTVVSVKLAEYLAKKKRNVLLIFADMTAPPRPCPVSVQLQTLKGRDPLAASLQRHM